MFRISRRARFSRARRSGIVVAVATAAGSVVAAALVVGGASSASAATGTLKGAGSARCVDVPSYSRTNGTQVHLYDCHGGANQVWSTTSSNQLTVYDSKCLAAEAGATTAGTRAVITDCSAGSPSSQQWTFRSDGTIANAQSGLCLDVAGAATGNGSKVILWTCHGQPNQTWSLSGASPGTPTATTTSPSDTPVARHGQLSVCGTRMCDRNGDAVQLRGISSMWLNWENNGYAEDLTAMTWMRDNWNMTVFRAAMGVEPAGAYASDPVKARQQVERIINNAVTAGVYVIVDYHAHEANNDRARAVSFFQDMAARYGHLPNVLWEPFNEPLQVSWTDVLKPYHEAVLAGIRASDEDNIVILGTPQWSQRVDEAAANPVSGSNLMYTLHFYSCSHTSWLRSTAESARNAGLALFVTEWGASHADGGTDGRVCLDEAQQWVDWMKTNGISWTAWKLDDCAGDSTCLLNPGAPVNGGWDDWLHGHAPFVRDSIRG